MADAIFANPRLADVYDALEGDRADLAHYAAMMDGFGATSVLDVGCGTGTLACLLARQGLDVTGIDPAEASLDVARRKPEAPMVRWISGDATTLPPLTIDVACMTGNVAQVFLDDDSWLETLRSLRNVLQPNGRLVFETRDPSRKAWEGWTKDKSFTRTIVPKIGIVQSWVEITDVSMPRVSFRWTFVFESDNTTVTSGSTLRFRTRREIEASLTRAGFAQPKVRDAPDRPSEELVFITSPR